MTPTLNILADMAATQPALRLLLDTAQVLRATTATFEDAPAVTAEDMVGGALLDDEMAVELSLDALDKTLARIDDLDRSDRRAQSAALAAGQGLREILDLPAPVRDAALDALEKTSWKFGGRGLRRLPLAPPTKDGVHVELLRIVPGAGTPRHDHEGDEVTLVLCGAYHDGHQRYGAGDIAIASKGLVHEPVAEPGEVCFALAVSVGDLRFKGAMGLVQRALRMH